MASCAAVTALTADMSLHPGSDWWNAGEWGADVPPSELRSMHGIWTRPPSGSQVSPKLFVRLSPPRFHPDNHPDQADELRTCVCYELDHAAMARTDSLYSNLSRLKDHLRLCAETGGNARSLLLSRVVPCDAIGSPPWNTLHRLRPYIRLLLLKSSRLA